MNWSDTRVEEDLESKKIITIQSVREDGVIVHLHGGRWRMHGPVKGDGGWMPAGNADTLEAAKALADEFFPVRRA